MIKNLFFMLTKYNSKFYQNILFLITKKHLLQDREDA
ncbi:hypothetical protein DOK78_002067 [Enterococcus sp. DIV2402]|uniref:Uncharacterized protein n=1 Tax=Candidatus Enterococcus lowellii TaxID=2230877 RepID=A0ABZ2SNR6_9ENTE